MIAIDDYIKTFSRTFNQDKQQPWAFIQDIEKHLLHLITTLDDGFVVTHNCAIHTSAVIETGVVLKGPMVIGRNCFVGAHSYLRNGVYLADKVRIGTGCEVKTSLLFEKTSIAHFNFIGDSIIGQEVNFEAGSITANHFNERKVKDIHVKVGSEIINTKVNKFGALIGDYAKIGANAVLSPGTVLEKDSVVKRLELVEQVPPHLL